MQSGVRRSFHSLNGGASATSSRPCSAPWKRWRVLTCTGSQAGAPVAITRTSGCRRCSSIAPGGRCRPQRGGSDDRCRRSGTCRCASGTSERLPLAGGDRSGSRSRQRLRRAPSRRPLPPAPPLPIPTRRSPAGAPRRPRGPPRGRDRESGLVGHHRTRPHRLVTVPSRQARPERLDPCLPSRRALVPGHSLTPPVLGGLASRLARPDDAPRGAGC